MIAKDVELLAQREQGAFDTVTTASAPVPRFCIMWGKVGHRARFAPSVRATGIREAVPVHQMDGQAPSIRVIISGSAIADSQPLRCFLGPLFSSSRGMQFRQPRACPDS